MTTTVPDAAGGSSPGTRPAPAKTGRRVAIAGVVVVAIGVGIAFGIHRWTSPTVFRGDGNGSSLTQRLTKFPLYAGFYPDGKSSETVTVHSADIHFTENSAGFTAKLLLCTRRPVKSGEVEIGTVNASEESLSQYCTSVHPIKSGTRMRIGPYADQYFVAVLTPSRAGTADIGAINIRYSRSAHHFFQHGTQHVAQNFTLVVKK